MTTYNVTVGPATVAYPGGIYDIDAYGADNTGAADSSTAIQAAIDAASAAGGGCVYVPMGTYLVNSSLSWADDVVLMGCGPNTRTSAGGSSHGSVLLSGITDGSAVIEIDNAGWTINDIAINGNDKNCIGIRTADDNNSYRWQMRGVNIHNCSSHGIYFDAFDNRSTYMGSMVSCTVHNCGTGVYAGGVNASSWVGCYFEHNAVNFSLEDSSGVEFTGCTFEGHSTSNVTIDGCIGVAFRGCYFEASTGDNGWHIKAGFSTACEEISVVGGRITRAGTTGTDYSLMFDDVDGVTVTGVGIDNRWQQLVLSTTANTRRVKFDSALTGAGITDTSMSINPAFNYFKDPTLRLGSSGYTWSLTNVTTADETTTYRTDGAAIKIASDAALDPQAYGRLRLDDEILDLFKGREIRAGAWVYVPDVSGYGAKTSLPGMDFSGAVSGTGAGNWPLTQFVAGKWNFMTCTADVDGSETDLYLRFYVVHNSSDDDTAGTEYVIVDNIFITDGFANEWDLAAGRVVPHPTTFTPTGVVLQSGTADPSHAAAYGTIYVRTDTGAMFVNDSGSTTWASVNVTT